MRNNKKKQKKPLLFFSCVALMSLAIIVYATTPSEKRLIKAPKTFEEQLEYNKAKNNQPPQNQQIKDVTPKDIGYQQNSSFTNNLTPTANTTVVGNKEKIIEQKQLTEQEKYDNLLDTIKNYPTKDIYSIEKIVNELLKYKGYPYGTVPVHTDIEEKSMSEDSYMAASFDYVSGEIKISNRQIYNSNIKETIAILAHELDHFDKYAKVCKSMGTDEFKAFFEKNGKKGINTEFWQKASIYADTKNFDLNTYKNAIERYLTQNKIELTSSYSDFYRLSENIRNPLEVSAYSVSDYVFKHYNMPVEEGPIKHIAKQFDNIDKALEEIVRKDPTIKDERVSLFDYFYSNAAIKIFPAYKELYDNCITNADGDLTVFWMNFEKILSNFYINGQLDSKSVQIIDKLLQETLNEANKNITDKQISDALKYKAKLIISNIVYPNAISNIKKTSLAYLQFCKKNGINDPKTELDFILTLICIQNELYTNKNNEISLYYIKLPSELETMYNITNKFQRFGFIYNNSEFIRLLENSKNETEQSLLISLLNSHRLNVRN